MSDTIRTSVRTERQRIDVNDPEQAVRATYSAAIDGLLNHPLMAELLLSHRRDCSSPLGVTVRDVLETSRLEMVEDMRAMGLSEDVLPHVDTHAALLQSMSLAAVEMILDQPEANKEQILDALVHTTAAMIERAVSQPAPTAKRAFPANM